MVHSQECLEMSSVPGGLLKACPEYPYCSDNTRLCVPVFLETAIFHVNMISGQTLVLLYIYIHVDI